MRAFPDISRRVILMIDPFHDLGRAVGADLCRAGLRIVAISDSPGEGEAFSTRLALEGACVPHRALHRDDVRGEDRLAADLKAVYGGLRGVLSFFCPPVRSERWLELPLTAANELIRESLNRRLRLLRALTPLLAGSGFLQNVIMGVVSSDGAPATHANGAAAHLWDDLLAGEWERRGVLVRRTYTRLVARSEASSAGASLELHRVRRDFDRCLARTDRSDAA